MLWKWIKNAKDFSSWYSFGSNIVKFIVWIGLFSGVGASVVGVPAAIIKGVPWPITLMAGFAVFIAVACLAATPLIIRAAIQSLAPSNALQPTRPYWDSWKHYEKFTVHEAACLLENLEPSIHSKDPKIPPRMGALCAAVRTGKLDFVREKQGRYDEEDRRGRRQQRDASSTTEIPRAALLDFAKRNNIDLRNLGQ
jgi:hypothetical protein